MRKRRIVNRQSSAKRRTSARRVRRATNGGKTWSRQEISFMRRYYPKYPTKLIAKQLGRTVYSVRWKASDLAIRKAHPSVWRGNA